MERQRLFRILGFMVWFGIAAAILVNDHRERVALEAHLEEGRKWNREHPDADEIRLEWADFLPRVHQAVLLPLFVAGILAGLGRWKAGLIFGIPSVATAIWMLWKSYLY